METQERKGNPFRTDCQGDILSFVLICLLNLVDNQRHTNIINILVSDETGMLIKYISLRLPTRRRHLPGLLFQ